MNDRISEKPVLNNESIIHPPTLAVTAAPKEGQAIQVEADVAGGPAGQ